MTSTFHTPKQVALDRAVAACGGKTALMRKLNERGHAVGSHNTIARWRDHGTPTKYAPDIERFSGERCEDICPDQPWTRVPDPFWPTSLGRPVLDFARALELHPGVEVSSV